MSALEALLRQCEDRLRDQRYVIDLLQQQIAALQEQAALSVAGKSTG
jgi:hypothetical protein